MADKDERTMKVEHNEEVHEKMKTSDQGILGDEYVRHHEERCRG